MKKTTLLTLLMIFAGIYAFSQITVTLPTVAAPAIGQTIDIPVTVSGADPSTGGTSLAGIDLNITFDAAVLSSATLINYSPLCPSNTWVSGIFAGQINTNWSEPTFSTSIPFPDGTILFYIHFTYAGGSSTLHFLKNEFYDVDFNLLATNPVDGAINAPATAPTAFAVTGSGSYCIGSGGLPVGVANSQIGVTYTLIKDGSATATTVAGTGSAISFGNQLAGTYTASGTNTGGTTAMTGSAIITETALATPTFTQLGPYCQGAAPEALPTTSSNGITGTWNPSTISTVSVGTLVYTFTPTSGLCASTTTMSVVITTPTLPTFTQLGPYCVGATPGTLPSTSNNAVTGTWNPSAINTSAFGTTVYTFSPSGSQCASTTTMSVVVNALPAAVAGSNSPVIVGGTLTLFGSPNDMASYSWSGPNGFSSTIQNPTINGVTLAAAGTYTLVVTNSNTCTAQATTEVAVNPISVPVSSTWNGSVNSDWFNASNWTNSPVGAAYPGATTSVTIPSGAANFPTLTVAASCASLVINSGGSFIGTEFLTTGSAQVERNITNSDFHFISSPVMATTFGNVFPLNQTEVWVREYNETTGDWDNLAITNSPMVGKGYSVQMTQPQTAIFSGVLNSSALTASLSKLNPSSDVNRVGWNLLGNPFASAIDWDLTNHSAIDGSVYVWNGSNYISWNGTIGALTDGIIPAQNAFFAKTIVDGATMTMPLSSRVHSSTPFYKSSVANMLELTAEGNSYSDKTFVHFNDQASVGFDNQYDAYKLTGIDSAPQLYSFISGEILSINELPIAGNEIVDLGFKCNANGIYTINATGTNNFSSNVPIFLKDIKLNVIQDLKTNPVYSFSYMTGDPENRFKICFLDITGVEELKNSGIKVFSFDKTVVIENSSTQSGTIGIYDVTGREICKHELISSQTRTNIPVQATTGTYIVKVFTTIGTMVTKVVLR
jgi:hypothetical protein